MPKARDQSFAKTCLEFVKAGSVKDPRQKFSDVIGFAQICRYNSKNVLSIIKRIFFSLP